MHKEHIVEAVDAPEQLGSEEGIRLAVEGQHLADTSEPLVVLADIHKHLVDQQAVSE